MNAVLFYCVLRLKFWNIVNFFLYLHYCSLAILFRALATSLSVYAS